MVTVGAPFFGKNLDEKSTFARFALVLNSRYDWGKIFFPHSLNFFYHIFVSMLTGIVKPKFFRENPTIISRKKTAFCISTKAFAKKFVGNVHTNGRSDFWVSPLSVSLVSVSLAWEKKFFPNEQRRGLTTTFLSIHCI
jgi:hypothetical protein